MPAIHVRVLAAFLETGSRNACTPFAIASTPVIAAQPDANARMSRNSVKVCTGSIASLAEGTVIAAVPLVRATKIPKKIMKTIKPMKANVGPANRAPDSFTPRRLPTMSSTTKKSAMGTVHASSWGNADVIAAVPLEMDTATVST